MSIDMSQFYQVFFEESAEHLASMESLLLELDLDAPDADQLNAIFRAAHSIKGGSGTFGFTDMTEVTHVLETLLDRIRKNEIAITADMVDAFLQAGDVLHGLLEAHQNGTVADEAASLEIRARLEKLTAEGGQRAAGSGQKTETAEAAHSPAQHIYRIKFDKSPAIFPGKAELDNLLEELGNIGKIENQEIAAESVTLTLATYAAEADLRDTFSFFLEPEQLTITLFDGQKAEDTASGEDQGYGFFVEPEKIQAASEDAQGYGFFVEPETVKSEVENAQGYGFFTEVESQPPATEQVATSDTPPDNAPQRRATDRAPAAAAETSIRVSVEKVDQMINLVGELVITQAMLAETASHLDPVLNERLVNGLAQLERNTRDLQESVMSVRMMPINFVFSRFPRVVRDLAGKLGKRVQLKMIGEGTELDKGLIEKISDPLTHLVRNSLDHGIELPDEREAKGKDPQGTITLRAAHQGGNIVIEVTDDGAGLNREKILAKAREKGIPVGDNMSDADVWQMIFAPGFSTAAVITDVSGRGVGMDVVKKNIEGIGGRVEIASQQGNGSTITISLPLTLAILDGLSIAVGDQVYIVPLSFISESLQPTAADIKDVSGQGQVVHVRGEYLPLIALHKVFNIQPRVANPAEGILVLLEGEGKKVALFVDELIGQHQVVIKSLETNYRRVPGISGATIMGDGRVAMIMDVAALIKLAQR
ncbi:chemotaxis protein CheA [Candidatus Ferrigenium straubiae]|jgi:two-component system chemotaxis sensor kinase CheA|uniref:chemotaxis protein CheA n=1 Tax=Candidatus Ferrigenium straubiae TaxID=2919506 RepID=UPI003F4AE06B